MREIAAFGMILFVLWLVFPSGPVRKPPDPEDTIRQIDPIESRVYPNILKQDGHIFKKVYEKGGKHVYYCTCGTKITYYGD